VLQNPGTFVAQESADELRNCSLLKSLKTRIGMGSPLVGGFLLLAKILVYLCITCIMQRYKWLIQPIPYG